MNFIAPSISSAAQDTKTKALFYWLCLFVPLLLVLGRAVADIAMVVVSVAFLFYATYEKMWTNYKTWFLFCGALLSALLVSGILTPIDQQKAVLDAFKWCRYPIFVAAFHYFASGQNSFKRDCGVLLTAILCAVSLDTVVQFFFGESLSGNPSGVLPYRLNGPFSNFVVGVYLCHLLWISIGLMADQVDNTMHKKLVLFVYVCLVSFTIIISGERMATLLLLMGFFLYPFFNRHIRLVYVFTASVLTCAAAVIIYFVPDLNYRFIQQIVPYMDNILTSPWALAWQRGLSVWLNWPLFGVGLDNFDDACKLLVRDVAFVRAENGTTTKDCFMHPHNIYIEWLAEAGLVGFSLFCILVFAILRKSWNALQQGGNSKNAIIGSVIAFLTYVFPLAIATSLFGNWNAAIFWWIVAVNFSLVYRR